MSMFILKSFEDNSGWDSDESEIGGREVPNMVPDTLSAHKW